LHVDYSVPVDRLRQKLDEIVRASPLWDRNVVNLQVTDTPGRYARITRPGQRPHPQPNLGFALRGAREADPFLQTTSLAAPAH
jgi:hypothetical protein